MKPDARPGRHAPQVDKTAGTVDPTIPTTFPAFVAAFSTEQACADYLFALRYPQGFVCPKCGSPKAWEAGPLREMICNRGHRTTITAGTIMHRTKQPLTTWFYSAYLVSTLTPGISALQFQKQLGIGRYETAFQLLHKLRASLVDPDREPLNGIVEVDEAFVGGVESARGRDDWHKSIVIVAVEVREIIDPDPYAPDDPNAGVSRTVAGRARMGVVDSNRAEHLLPFIAKNIAVGSTILTDGAGAYGALNSMGYKHEAIPASMRGKKTGKYLPMVGLITSNLKRWLLGTYKGAVRSQHLPAYLNEFVFRFNRRFWRGPAFVRALGLALAAEYRPEYDTLYGARDRRPGYWMHPNPGPGPTGDVVDMVWSNLRRGANPDVRAWMDLNAEKVRRTIADALFPEDAGERR